MSKTNSESSQEADLGSLKQQRTTLKRHITNIKAKIDKNNSKTDASILDCQMEILEGYYAQITHVQTQIEKIDVSDNHRDEIEDSFIAAKAKLIQLLNKQRPSVLNSTTNSSVSSSQRSRLPQLKLPKFSGNYMDFSRFLHTFQTLVDDDISLSTIDKFNYLLDCLSGQALAVVEPYQVNDDNYEVALKRLKERFDNKSLIFNENIKTLFSLQAMEKGNPVSLRALIDKAASIKSSLLTIGNESDIVNAMFTHLVVSKLDVDSSEAYAEKQDFKSLPSFDKCYETLGLRCQYLESRSQGSQSTDPSQSKSKQKGGKSSKSFVATKSECAFCQSADHSISRCNNFKALSATKKLEYATKNTLCYNCLSNGHRSSKCSSKYRCRECKAQHHTLLHGSVATPPISESTIQPQQPPAAQQSSKVNPYSEPFVPTQQLTLLTRTAHRAIIPTAVVLIKDAFGIFQPIRALLDSCSEINLITEEAAKRLRLPQLRSSHVVKGIDETSTRIKFAVKATIRSRISEFEWTSLFAAIKSISNVQPSESIETSNWKLPRHIEYADPLFYKPQRVDLLISSEVFFDLLLDGKIDLGENRPSLVNTTLGWIVGGKFGASAQTTVNRSACHFTTHTSNVEDTLRKFWEVEDYVQFSPPYSAEEQACENHFLQSVTFAADGRVQVGLPFKTVSPHLGDSFEAAQKRFFSLERRLNQNEVLKRHYIEFMSEYESLGHMSAVSNAEELWIARVNWDESLPDRLLKVWIDTRDDLHNINSIQVPRYVLTSPTQTCEIHGFSDASERAYGCCLYVRVVQNGSYTTNLLIAKSKVAPVKSQSLPRLELCAALLLVRTWIKFRHKFENLISQVYFWTDSKIVLLWLKQHANSLSTFVSNRVSEIQSFTQQIIWRHCPSKSNPADIVSRGCSAQGLSATMWFSGPQFLQSKEENWPTAVIDAALPESEKRKSYSLKCTKTSVNDLIELLTSRHSSYLRIIHIVVYIFRVFNKVKPDQTLRKSKIFSPISTTEIDNAFHFIVSALQHSFYATEMTSLSQDKLLPSSLQKLAPFVCKRTIFNQERQLLRVGGRLAQSSLPIEAKFPLLVPRHHRFVQLYAEYLHRRHLHAGTKVLISLIRQRLWILNIKSVASKVVRNCTHCFKYRPKLAQQIMADLPADRFRSLQAFLICGVDFCGPFKTSYRIRSKVPYKTYVAIFVCFASKAVHIELVSDLSTDAFIGCLKRFVGRRGIPQKIYCDNATNFAGANNKLKQFYEKFLSQQRQSELLNHCTSTGFEFRFIPPRSPHFGGLWEAAVKSTKQLLIKHLTEANLSYEELLTITTEVEAILNSRPLAIRSDDPNDGAPLTPAHLMGGVDLMSVPEPHIHSNQISHLTRWQRITFIKQQFWRQWLHDYVLDLQTRSRWLTEQSNVRVSQVVLIHDDNLPPQQWLLARITNVLPGADGRIRVVDLRTNKGMLRRAIHKIAPLPLIS